MTGETPDTLPPMSHHTGVNPVPDLTSETGDLSAKGAGVAAVQPTDAQGDGKATDRGAQIQVQAQEKTSFITDSAAQTPAQPVDNATAKVAKEGERQAETDGRDSPQKGLSTQAGTGDSDDSDSASKSKSADKAEKVESRSEPNVKIPEQLDFLPRAPRNNTSVAGGGTKNGCICIVF